MSSESPYRVSGQAWLSALVVCVAFTVACGAASDALDDPAGAGSSSAGSPSSAGATAKAGSGSVASAGQFTGFGGSSSTAGSGGSIQSAGAGNPFGGSGGAIAAGGTGGAGGGKAGAGGTGGTGGGKAGSGGSSGGSFGAAGRGGQSSGGSTGMGGSAPTWTEIYTKFLSNNQYGSNCNGSDCHNPGKQKGYDFSSQANGYASVKSSTSRVVSELSSGGMPKGKPKMPAADLAMIKAWVAAGAMNN